MSAETKTLKPLAPCPFCGSIKLEVRHSIGGWGIQVCCDDCGTRGPVVHTHRRVHSGDAAWDRWNQRAQQPSRMEGKARGRKGAT